MTMAAAASDLVLPSKCINLLAALHSGEPRASSRARDLIVIPVNSQYCFVARGNAFSTLRTMEYAQLRLYKSFPDGYDDI